MISRIVVHATIAVIGLQAAGEILTITRRLDGVVDMAFFAVMVWIYSKLATLTERSQNQDREIAEIRRLVLDHVSQKAVNE